MLVSLRKNGLDSLFKEVRVFKVGRVPLPVFGWDSFGHPQTCVYPDVCLGIDRVSGKAPCSGTRGLVDTPSICPAHPTDSWGGRGRGRGVYQIPCPRRGFARDIVNS